MANPLAVFEESRNTGQDLLNPNHLIFTSASVHLLAAETDNAINILTMQSGREIKFSKLVNMLWPF